MDSKKHIEKHSEIDNFIHHLRSQGNASSKRIHALEERHRTLSVDINKLSQFVFGTDSHPGFPSLVEQATSSKEQLAAYQATISEMSRHTQQLTKNMRVLTISMSIFAFFTMLNGFAIFFVFWALSRGGL
ncbi:MAG: hypothetical protein ACPGWR_00905 [Ardenticatenaceae bacterium]